MQTDPFRNVHPKKVSKFLRMLDRDIKYLKS